MRNNGILVNYITSFKLKVSYYNLKEKDNLNNSTIR